MASVPPREEALPVPAPAPARAETVPGAADHQEEADARVLGQLAAGEDPEAAAAVTWVVLNRAGCSVRPLRCRVPVLEVVRARRQFGTRKGHRWLAAWSIRRDVPDPVAAEVAAVLSGERLDPTGGATHFHRVGTWVPPYAPPPGRWFRSGSHAFYRAARLNTGHGSGAVVRSPRR